MSQSILKTLLIKVRGETRDFEVAMKRARKEVRNTRDRLKDLGNTSFNVTRAMAGMVAGGYVAKQLFDIGSAAEETASKFNTVFGASSEQVDRFIDQFGTLAGLSRTQAREVTATTGAIVQGMGFAADASADYATQVVRLAGDLSSFNNIPIEETSRAIQAAITGEREQLKRLGIVIQEADVQQRALAMSGKESAKALTQQEKAAATLALITQRAGVAIGDLERTQDSAANRARQFAAELQNIREELAVALLPVMTWFLDKAVKFVKGLQIMGAEAAVFVAKVQLLTAKMKFWDKEGIEAATRNLEFMRQAAEEVKLEVVGLGGGVETAGAAMAAGYTQATEAAQRLLDTQRRLNEMQVDPHGITTEMRENRQSRQGPRNRADGLFFGNLVDPPEAKEAVSQLRGEQQAFTNEQTEAATAQEKWNAAVQKGALAARGLQDAIAGFKQGGFSGILKGALGLFSTAAAFIPGLGTTASAISGAFAGFFANGGNIPSGSWGIVGERGPEVVSGPANVTPMGGGMSAALEAAIAAVPSVPMTPEAYAYTDYFRRVFSVATADGHARGVRA